MAIDAVISGVEEYGDELKLNLSPRIDSNGLATNPGQEVLIIKNFTWKPEIGQEIWGGSGSIIIEPKKNYIREGYLVLHEDFKE